MLRSHARRSVRITVIVPAYRGWSTLPGALDALAPQLTAEHEVVLLQSERRRGIRPARGRSRCRHSELPGPRLGQPPARSEPANAQRPWRLGGQTHDRTLNSRAMRAAR